MKSFALFVLALTLLPAASIAQQINSLDTSGAPRPLSILQRLKGESQANGGSKFILKKNFRLSKLSRYGYSKGRGRIPDEAVYPLFFKSGTCIAYLLTNVDLPEIERGVTIASGEYHLWDAQVSSFNGTNGIQLTLQPRYDNRNRNSIGLECNMSPRDSLQNLQAQIGSAFNIIP